MIDTRPSVPTSFVDELIRALRDAGSYNKSDQSRPAVILWPDHDRQWEPLLPLLRPKLPLLALGSYSPSDRTGPAYWIRCMIARTIPEDVLPEAEIPIVYLPGISRQDIRAVEDCPRELQPLAELQYRGVFWSHRNGRDWTVAAFLQSPDGGLGIDVAGDGSTREALQRALVRLAREPVETLSKEAPLRAPFFDALLNPDEVRSLLLWLDDPAGFRKQRDESEWKAFCNLCSTKYGLRPAEDGEIAAARRLGERKGQWGTVWQRFAESPASYPGLPELLRQARPKTPLPMFEVPETWPQDNEAAEDALRQALLLLENKHPAETREAIAQLEAEHGQRRDWVWEKLGQAPLARALEHLAQLASATQHTIGGTTVAEIGNAYADSGWKADAASLKALAEVEEKPDVAAVQAALLSVYRPWLEAGAIALQQVVVGDPANAYIVETLGNLEVGTCLLFSDGLRFDLAQRLADLLATRGVECGISWRLAALPTVTSTAKLAVTPVVKEAVGGPALDPVVRGSGTPVNVEVLRKLLGAADFQVLRGDDTGDPSGRGWTEVGDIDSYGHEHGWKVAHHAPGEIRALASRVVALVDAGWKQVVLVTDHGWLMLPGGLPKASLAEYLTVARKGRCARLKDDAIVSEPSIPWYWDSQVRVATPRGIQCYEAGRECEHGGISPQECVTPLIRAVRKVGAKAGSVAIESVSWRGLRCSVTVSGSYSEAKLDIRQKAADPASSLATAPRAPDAEGKASLLVVDDDRAGDPALVVVVGTDGSLLAQTATIVGG